MNIRHVVADFSHTFPHATNLTLIGNYTNDIHSFIDNLGHIIPLTQITHLNISYNDYCFNSIAKLLTHMPNVNSLVLDKMPTQETNFLSEEQVNIIDQVYNNNVTDVYIDVFKLNNIQLLINLFPQMKILSIDSLKDNLVPIVRTILLKISDNSPLFSLTLSGNDETVEQLRTMIDGEKLIDDYTIEHEANLIKLWW
jgi:hypothetical protein